MRILLSLLLVSLCYNANADNLKAAIEDDYANNLEALFKHFHKNPELSFREFETAKRLAQELENLGVDVTRGVGGTGIVGMLRNGEGPTVLVRADMDGLPVRENTGLPYASIATQEDISGEVVPVMHACGHDVHMTSMVGTAKQLINRRQDWSGTVMFVGQPAEERIGGARAMLKDKMYETFGIPDYALAFHVSAGRPAGKISTRAGLAYSSSNSVDITVYGIGAHGAAPHTGVDPILLASQIVVSLQSIVSREIDPLKPGVITVGSFHGGFKHNIIPNKVELQLTVRSDDEATRAKLLASIKRIAEGLAFTAGLPKNLYPKVNLDVESTPALFNDAKLTARITSTLKEKMGKGAFYHSKRQGMGAEDFAYFVMTEDKVPGTYFSVGGTKQSDLDDAKKNGTVLPSHHSPIFQIEPEPSITTGTMAMTTAVLELLKK